MMSNEEIIQKLKEDMELRNFSEYTKYSYLNKTKHMIEYFNKPLEEVTTDELRKYLLEYLKKEKGQKERSINYCNSVIRFVYEVTLDKVLNKKQLPMLKRKKGVYKVLTKDELRAFFNACKDNYKYTTMFMLIYGSGLRIGEVVNLRKQDIDSKNMRIFVQAGKGNKERYTVLPEASLKMLRKYWKNYREKNEEEKLFLSESGKAITVGVIREHFREYRRKAKLDEKVTCHTLRHCFATDLIERGATLIEVKELMGHSNIRSTMEYIHVANLELSIESPLDAFLKGVGDGKNTRNIK